MRVKICGITNLEDAVVCQKHGADALGFIFYHGSKRYIKPEDANPIIDMLSPFIVKVGVFVNEKADTVNQIAEKLGLSFVQLHGDETPSHVAQIRWPVIKSFRVHHTFDFAELAPYKHCHFLLDTYNRNDYGGTGTAFNWKMIPASLRKRIILAGGISQDNIDEIFQTIRPAAIDLSSSLESRPGKKDHNKVEFFFQRVKQWKINN
ncbi:MAG: phosphoribosylanthranilate isomerase [Caldithrix sp.]|nr:phosphoribosylanthranilate isomerase [Caldithrix sp.]